MRVGAKGKIYKYIKFCIIGRNYPSLPHIYRFLSIRGLIKWKKKKYAYAEQNNILFVFVFSKFKETGHSKIKFL